MLQLLNYFTLEKGIGVLKGAEEEQTMGRGRMARDDPKEEVYRYILREELGAE